MHDALGALAAVALMALVLAIPITIVRMTRAAEARRREVIAAWAREHGMTPSSSSAIPTELQGLYSGVVSLDWRGGVLSILAVTSRGETTYSLYWRSGRPAPFGPAYAVARQWGSGFGHVIPVVPTNDPDFDAAFDARAADARDVPRVFTRELRAIMMQKSEALDTVSGDGASWSVTQRTRDEDTAAWDRALAILEVADAAARRHAG